jgi:hypothetical protein
MRFESQLSHRGSRGSGRSRSPHNCLALLIIELRGKFALIAAPSLFVMTSAIAAMPEPDAWNIGSVLAAAHRCEMNNFITQGQTTTLMTKLFLVLSPAEQQFIRTGYLEGNKRDSVYSISQKQWFAVPMTAKACNGVQYALDQYKSISNSSVSQYLTGSAREDFIKDTPNGCMRAKINDEEAKIVPNSLFEGHCRCYASALADKLTIADMRSDNKAVKQLQPKSGVAVLIGFDEG